MNQIPQSISELTLAPTTNAWARRHNVDTLQRRRFPAESIEIARLLVSELATNAIQHDGLPMSTTAANAGTAPLGTIVLRL
ncbi:hypothetical protein [Streptomyces anulatus]|uniref:hypothetical protein n=1 Tax=Streptomyces anulatus TaxID=1892 RepID=UPI002E0FFBAD|nr:hypothetical protein OG557_21150 [Streptomyces anulatus]